MLSPFQLLTAAALALTTSVNAFADTSPYFIASSSSSIPETAKSHNIVSTNTFVDTARDIIKRCDSDAYVLVSQPGLHIEDLTARKHVGVHIKDFLQTVGEEKSWVARNVFPMAGADMIEVMKTLQEFAKETCDAEIEGVDAKTGTFKVFDDMKPKVVTVNFEKLAEEGTARTKMVQQNDAFLHSVFDMLPTKKFTLIFTSSPIDSAMSSPSDTQASVDESSHGSELKIRSVNFRDEDSNKNGTKKVEGGLFHRYQFFTPAIFMGYLALFFMLAVLYVGLTAVSSLSVSYGAFDKEMGPAAAKKQQ